MRYTTKIKRNKRTKSVKAKGLYVYDFPLFYTPYIIIKRPSLICVFAFNPMIMPKFVGIVISISDRKPFYKFFLKINM